MVRVRLEGMTDEVRRIAAAMQAAGCVLERSREYAPSRGESGYVRAWDVRYDPDRAKELLETGPREYDRLPDGRPYDGRPWWQA